VLKGRYGPYVSDGETNATIPEASDPEQVTLEQAEALIAERLANGGGKKEKKKAAPKPKAEAKTKPEKPEKPPAKKAAPKKKAAAKKKPEPVAGE
jgi:DNA topoisomerase-1